MKVPGADTNNLELSLLITKLVPNLAPDSKALPVVNKELNLQSVTVNSKIPVGVLLGEALIINRVASMICTTYCPLSNPIPRIYIPGWIPEVLVTTNVVFILPIGL